MPGKKMTVEEFQQFLMVVSAEVGRGASMEGSLEYSWNPEGDGVVVRAACRNGNDMGQGGMWLIQGEDLLLAEHWERKEAEDNMGWRGDPGATITLDVLTLVRAEVPGPELTHAEVENWSEEQRYAAVRWAGAVHLAASDNDVEVPPRPAFLEAR